ncbi:MAG: copper resistance protein CopC/CopD, partial [Chloroflexia bacterium]|nr:copper resistance protein CopC/CopD [Chloroflexia bacterium]
MIVVDDDRRRFRLPDGDLRLPPDAVMGTDRPVMKWLSKMPRFDAVRRPNGAAALGQSARGRVILLVMLLIGLIVARPESASAHAALKESDPAPNAILATAPSQVRLVYTEPLERSYSRAELYDQAGNRVGGAASGPGADDYQMLVDLPASLPNGTYSVLWRSLSTADGHTAQGYFAFTVGTAADVRTVVPPATTGGDEGPPDWLRTTSRWLALLGLAATVAVWPIWLFVVRPALSPVWQLGPGVTRRIRWFAAVAVAFAIGGSVVALLVQAAGIGGGEGLLSGLRTTLGETRYGTLWLIRIGLYLIFAAALMGAAWWWPWRRAALSVALLGFSGLMPLPFSLIAHAAAQPAGRATAIAFDLLHIVAASLWVGGLFVLMVGLVPALRDLTPAGRREVLARAIPRFSTIALMAWAIIGVSGLYSAWINVGNLAALRTTDYGKTLILKLLLLVPLLALAAFNLLIVNRRLRRARAERTATIWSGFFVTAIAAEAVLVIVVLLVVGRLTAQPPARDVV